MGLEKLGIRSLVTVVFGPLIIVAAWKGGLAFLVVIVSIVFLSMHEFYNLAIHKVTSPEKVIGIGTGVILCLLAYFSQPQNIWILLAASFFLLLVVELFRNEVGPILNISTTLMGVFYVGLSFGFLILIREFPRQSGLPYQQGGKLIILLFLAIWVCDSAAYILGSRLGKHKLFERVSPNKTIEGTIFGFLFAVLTAYLCQLTFIPELGLRDALVIGGICGSLGQISDLIESMFKRDARVKDASNLIPGHGGILDRFDSEILVAPAVYFYLVFVVV